MFTNVRFGVMLLIASTILLIQCTSTSTLTDKTTKGGSTRSTPAKEDRLRADIVRFSKKYLGTKYRYAGKDPKGFDCSGFSYFVYKNHDIALGASSRAQAGQGKKINDLEMAKPADLVFFNKNANGSGGINHVGIIVKNEKNELLVIHSTSRGVVIDDVLSSSYWKPRILAARNVVSD